MNPLFPLSLAGATILAALLLGRALAPGAEGAEAVGFTLLGSLAALAAMEHAVLMLPLSLEGLWRSGLGKRAAPRMAPSAAAP
jgi:putative photosynthetic complex assembly protein 2